MLKVLFHGIYKGLKVFVTGHTGFKGSWLSQWLLELEAHVTGYSLNVPTHPSHFEELGLKERMQHREGDIRNLSSLKEAMQDCKPDIVFHLAAQAIVSESYKDPVKTFETNAIGTANILEAVRSCPSVRAVVMITSDKCYENVEWAFGYRENDRLGGKDPYSASKACAENIIYAYWNSFFSKDQKKTLALSSARAGNVIGGGDWAQDRIIPDCMRAWAQTLPVELRNPRSTRPWQHVLEPLSGYLCLGMGLLENNQNLYGESFNFGPDASVTESVEVLVKALSEHWPHTKWTTLAPSSDIKEASLLKLSCDKALFHMKWQANLTFSETVAFTGSWYRGYYEEKTDAKSLTSQQIHAYQNLAYERKRVWAQ